MVRMVIRCLRSSSSRNLIAVAVTEKNHEWRVDDMSSSNILNSSQGSRNVPNDAISNYKALFAFAIMLYRSSYKKLCIFETPFSRPSVYSLIELWLLFFL
jgi:hypothetical protein